MDDDTLEALTDIAKRAIRDIEAIADTEVANLIECVGTALNEDAVRRRAFETRGRYTGYERIA